IGSVRLAAKVSPTLFLSVASVCLVAVLIAVPFGKVIIAAGSAALAAAAGFDATAGLDAAALVGAGCFTAAAGFAVLLASSVAVFEQLATVRTTATAAKASQKFRCT